MPIYIFKLVFIFIFSFLLLPSNLFSTYLFLGLLPSRYQGQGSFSVRVFGSCFEGTEMNTWEKAIRICYQTASPQQPGIINFRTAQGWDSGRECFPSSFSLYCSGVSQQVFTSRDNSADTNMRLQQRILQRPRVHSWPHRLVDLCAQAGTEFKGYNAWFNFVFSLLWNLSLFMNKTSCIFISTRLCKLYSMFWYRNTVALRCRVLRSNLKAIGPLSRSCGKKVSQENMKWGLKLLQYKSHVL